MIVKTSHGYPAGLDYSAGRVSGATLRDAGIAYVIRYTDQPGTVNRKLITKAEYDDLTAHGIAVYLVIEHGTQDWAGGTAAGRDLATRARAGADAIGYPAGWPIFVTADGHMIENDLVTWVAFVRGAVAVLGYDDTGAYAFSEGIDALLAAGGVCRWYWQPGSRSAVRDVTHVYQCNDVPNLVLDGVPCDVNELRRALPGPNPNQEQTLDTELSNRLDTLERNVTGAVHHDAGAVILGDPAHPDNIANLRTQLFGRAASGDKPGVKGALTTLAEQINSVDTALNATHADLSTRLEDLGNDVRDLAAQQMPALDYTALAAALLDQLAVRRAGGQP